jgi:hypothetical protein
MWRFLFAVRQWLRGEIVFGFLIATVFWTAVLGWQAAYAPTDAEKQKCYEAAERKGYKTEECKSLWERTTSDPVAFFTLWLVIFTGGLTISTVLLWRASERQIELAREASAAQSRDMQDSIATAVAANELSNKTFIGSQRPWVVALEAVPIGDLHFGQEIRISYTLVLKNGGASPATNVNWNILIWFPFMGGDDPHKLQRNFSEQLARDRSSRDYGNVGHLLVPDEPLQLGTMTQSHRVPVGASHFHAILVGCLDYRFPGENSFHQTGFMFQLARAQITGVSDNFGMGDTIFQIGKDLDGSGIKFQPFAAGFFAT